jgi:predicted nucleotidyltransferase
MDMYKLKFTKLQNEIMRLLCIKAGKQLNQAEIARLLKVSPTAIAKSLHLLEKEGLITLRKGEKINLNSVELNRDSGKAVQFKRAENLKLVYESGLQDFLSEEFPGCTIVLFGSYSKGEDTISSDIDIAIIGTKEKEIETANFEKILEKKIFINFYPSFKEIHKNLKENILNGIILKGGVEL